MEVVMKRFLLPLMLLCAFAVIGSPVSAKKPESTSLLPEDVQETLQFMREEEKLAHDVYAYFNTLYPEANTFENIMESEQRHTDAVADLLVKYGVADPVVVDANGLPVPGQFTDKTLQKLYDDLVDAGEESLEDALAVGVAIEEKDIEDINAAIVEAVGYTDIVRVYTNLVAGSARHLDGFLRALDALDKTQ
jgi:hypothetical protein